MSLNLCVVPASIASDALVKDVDGLLSCIRKSTAHWIIVSNEVGLGLVPPYPLGRIYPDVLGCANQRLAMCADQTLLMIAGIPTQLDRFQTRTFTQET